MKSTKAIFNSWRKFLLTETERPGPGHQKSRYEKKGEVIKLDGWGNACYYATGKCGDVVNEEAEDPDTDTVVKVVLYCGDRAIFLKNDQGWDLPGGHLKESEVDTPEVGAKREIKEETTLDIKHLTEIGKSGDTIFFSGEICEFDDDDITITQEHEENSTYFKNKEEIGNFKTQFGRIALKVLNND